MGNSIDLERYFERTDYRGSRTPSVEVLHGLTQTHTQSIPFENLDVLMGQPIRLEPDAVYRKLVLNHRGGYCFEQNGLLLEVLTRLGFTVRPLRAAVRMSEPDRCVAVRHTHLALEVLIDGESWITDVGVGSASLTQALRFTADIEQRTPHDIRRLQREDRKWFHQVRRGETWVDVYEFGGEAMPLPDRIIANWYTSTHPDSNFRRKLLVAKALPGGRRVSLHNDQLLLRGADGSAKAQQILDPNQLLDVLREYFGINLPKATRFRLDPAQQGRKSSGPSLAAPR